MNNFSSIFRRVTLILPLILLGFFLSGCATVNETTCRNSPLLITDLAKPPQARYTLLLDGTACPKGIA